VTTSSLDGLQVTVTRAAAQADELIELFEARGVHVERLPLLEIGPARDGVALERAASELALYQWLVLTSRNAVDCFMPLTGGALPPGLRLAVIGRSTARALDELDITPDLVPENARAEGLAAALAPYVSRRERVLLPQAADARPLLAERLRAAGADVVRVVAYEKRLPEASRRRSSELFSDRPLGWITFTSPSTVRGLVEVLSSDWSTKRDSLRALSIGPVTSKELRKLGASSIEEAQEPSDRGLVAALDRALEAESGSISERPDNP